MLARDCYSNSTTQAKLAFLQAEVIAKGDATYIVKAELQTFHVKTAFSFLFMPEIHDQVLLTRINDSYYISQIMARLSAVPLQLRIVNALTINAAQAQLIVQAEQLSLQGATLNLQHEKVHSEATRVDLAWQQTQLVSEHLTADIEYVQLTSEIGDYHVNQLTLKAKRVLQWISDLKQQMLGRLHVSVQKHYQLDCESVAIYSQDEVTIDAKQIHLG